MQLCKELLSMSEDSPHITMQSGITTFHCSRGVLAGDSVFLHSSDQGGMFLN